MAQPYIGEIRMFAGTFAPVGWLFCDGQLVPISENEALFQLIGTTYGGDGQSTFALPNLSGRLPVHQGNNYQLAETGGVESVTLTAAQTPVHSHAVLAYNSVANSANPGQNLFGLSSQVDMFYSDQPNVALNNSTIGITGGSQPHDNMMPYLCVNFIISQFGLFPSPT